MSVGRNFDEILRALDAIRQTDGKPFATPADWQPGDDVIVPPPGSCGTAKERVEKPAADCRVFDWFMVMKKCPH